MKQLPTKEDFLSDSVSEPLAVRLAGLYDIWDKRDPRAEVFQYGLRSRELSELDWGQLLSINQRASIAEIESLIDAGHNKDILDPDGTTPPTIIFSLLKDGELLQRYQKTNDASLCKHKTWIMPWEGLNFLCVNSARFNSLLFESIDKPETGHDALLGFCYGGKNWMVSLYHANHRKDLDLSAIAVKYGGGGHRGACGFTCDKLPFQL